MKDQSVATKAVQTRGREGVLARFSHLRAARSSSTLRTAEIVGLTASAALLLITLVFYFYSLAPARTRLATLRRQHAELQKQLNSSAEGLKSGENAAATIKQIKESLRGFEYERLKTSSLGRTAVIEELNDLIRRNNTRIAGPIAFTSIDPAPLGEQASRSRDAANDKDQSIFPGMSIKLTVEGPYANLRRLIRDIEASRQFVVVNGIELEGVTDTGSSSAGGAGSRVPRGSLVSLRLDIAAYFQRNATNVASVSNGEAR